MVFAIIAAVVFGLLTSVFLGLWLLLKRDLKKANSDLKAIVKTDTNKKLTSLSFDKDVCALENTINNLLDKQKKVLVESERINREFKNMLASMSHDLRTPLTSASGYLQMLKKGDLSKEKRDEYFDTVSSKLKSLTLLIDELFKFTLAIEGNSGTEKTKVNACAVLRDCLSMFYNDFELEKFDVSAEILEVPVYIMCDETSLRHIFLNLLKNMLMHGQNYAKIIALSDGRFIFSNEVKDTNIDIDRLFDRFYTMDFSRSLKSTGLGLAIVKALTVNMDGQISASLNGSSLSIIVDFSSAILSH